MNSSGYNKVDSILRIKELGLNMHNTVIVKNIVDAMKTVRQFETFTIRTDINSSKAGGWGNSTQLPFVMQKEPIKDIDSMRDQLNKLLNDGYTLIIADGIKYDSIQSYNGVAYIEEDGHFSVEMSTEKVPLRKMYSIDGVFVADGHIGDEIQQVEFYGEVHYNRHDIIRDMQDLYIKQIYGKWLEFTKYPIKVGERQENYVFWQIR